MNRRTLFLLAGAGLVGLFWLLDQGYRSFIEAPMRRDEAQLAKLEKNLVKAQDAQIESHQAAKRLDVFQRYSLPSNPELARSNYQDWLLQLLERHGLENRSVDPGQPVPVTVRSRSSRSKRRLVYHRLDFGLRAKGTLEQISAFMFDFYQAGHLHKIQTVALNPIGSGRQVDLSLSIEAIAMADCEREEALAEQTVTRLAYESVEDYRKISQRNLFARGYSRALAQVQLKAVTYDRQGRAQAWFQLTAAADRQIATAGEPLEIDLYEVELVDIQAETAILQVNGEVVRLEIGQSLGEAMMLNQAPATVLR